jgi:SAM-dependent methyltransferase
VHWPAYTLEDQERMSRAENYFAWQSRLVTRELGRRVVEVGCGLGNFTRMLLDREAVIAVDREPACIQRLTERYPDRNNLYALACDAGSPAFSGLARFHPDSCVCLNVLEHIEDDRQALHGMASILAPAGVIVLLVPAFPALYGPIDRNLGHYRRYTRGSIARLAGATGLRIRKAHYMNAAGFFGWWMNSHIFKRGAQSERQIEIFDRYLVPLLSRVEGLARPPFGQSLFVVLEKP